MEVYMRDKMLQKGIFALSISLLLMNFSSKAQVPEPDSLALVALYDSTAGANWTNNTNWLSSPVQNWYGITVSQGRVTAIQLGQNNLIGTIPNELGNLTELSRLNLRNNQISGEIPVEIGNLTKLTQLFLENNQLTGIIPTEIGNLVDLEQLDLHFNDLSGTIPPGIFNMTKLITLILFGNDLSGKIPKEIGNLVNLESLELYSNLLTGEIPTEIGNLTKLRRLFLAINQFTGVIPASIGNLINLTNVQLHGNQLTGTIPSEIGNLTDLQILLLRNNQLDGPIPAEIGNLTNLTQLKLSFNQLSGSIPSVMGNLINMRSMELQGNQLTGAVPVEMGSLTQLLALELNNNQLNGAIPAEFTNFNELEFLALHSNMLEDLPDLSSLDSLNEIRIYSNKFTFEDIEPNITIPTILYSPQDSVGLQQDTTIDENESLTLSVMVGGTANQYQWMKDDVDVPDADSSSYIIESAIASDSGAYVCRITNTIATELALYSRPVKVKVSSTSGLSDETPLIFKNFELQQNFPNPFNPITTIQFQVAHISEVSLKIFNILGEEVVTLVSDKLAAGQYTYEWDASRLAGIASGIYIYQLKAAEFIQTKKMVLMR
jgi:Leucine-rich repeat (LRR) protein